MLGSVSFSLISLELENVDHCTARKQSLSYVVDSEFSELSVCGIDFG